jgi:hypothetical protein
MIAVTILAFSLVAVYAATAGAVGATKHVDRIGVATMLARCRMTEVEEGFRIDGFQLDDVDEDTPCCLDEDEAAEGYTCHTKVEAVELPEMSAIQTAASGLANGDPLGLTGAAEGAADAAGAEGEAAGMDEAMTAGLNVLYPLVSNVLQASIRRVTVDVSWTEGEETRTVQAVQYVTNPTQGVEAGKAPPPSPEDAAQPAGEGSPAPEPGGDRP